jgi:TATA-box binding protein (TBP) (component of TFIID and TFIIIB)
MAIVSSTAVFRVKDQDIDQLMHSEHRHISTKRLRRRRKTTAFHNVVFKYPFGKVVFLIYRNGKVVVLGSRSKQQLLDASNWLTDTLKSQIIEEPKISNFVYTYQSSMRGTNRGDTLIHLYNHIHVMNNGKNIRAYLEPELSPALIYHPACNNRAKAMMFRSGKVTITGINSEHALKAVRSEIDELLGSGAENS